MNSVANWTDVCIWPIKSVSPFTWALFWCLFSSLLRSSGNRHQNNPLVKQFITRVHTLLSNPGQLGDIIFGPFPPSPPPPPPSPPPPFCQHFSTFRKKTLKLISSNHTWLTYGLVKTFWHPSRWPGVKVTKLPKRDRIYLVSMIKREPLIQSLQNLVGISPCHACLAIFFRKISNAFFPSLKCYLPHLRNGWSNWCETKRKWVNWMLRWLGYLWTWPLTLTLNFQDKMVSRDWEARLSWNERVGNRKDNLRWNTKEMGQLDAALSGVSLALTFDLQGQIVSREWEAWLSWNERDGSR